MENSILLLALLFFSQDIICNEDLLSKFHQNGYKLKDVRMQLMSYDKDFFKFFEIKAFKFNRTTTAHNATFNLKKNSKDDLEVLVQVYKFYSNEYRYFPIRFQVNLKKAVDANVIGLKDTRKCGNVTSFYFYKDVTYRFCNFVIDENHFPPLVPNGKYKIAVTFLYFEKEVALISIFVEVYIPIKYPKK